MRLDELLREVEGPEFEAKAAQGGLPGSLWETYSAFANSSGGGLIVLGLKEQAGRYTPVGLHDPARLRKNLFDCLNDRAKVSTNVLRDGDVREIEVEGKRLLEISVPEAPRRLKPVYINGDPMRGTFQRFGEGDYRCNEETIRRMWAEASDARDARILRGYTLDKLDPESLRGYRNVFRSVSPDHVWVAANDQDFLTYLGGWRRDEEQGEEGLTLAGLLMFGRERAILDAVSTYQVDYREADPIDPRTRWTYRHTVDGTWVPNLFQFFYRTINRLTREIAIPFRLEGIQRIDDNNVTAALREALVNALIHTDYQGSGGIVILRQPQLFQFENPGDLRVPAEQAMAGGISDCRNPSLQKMFRLLGFGEQAGSGLPRLRQAWAEQAWRTPDLSDRSDLYRTSLRLPTTSLLPDESLDLLRGLHGERRFATLSRDAVLAAVTAHVEGQVTRGRLAAMTALHPVDAAALLKQMANEGLPAQTARRGVYVLPTDGELNPPISGRSPSDYDRTPRISGRNPSDYGRSPSDYSDRSKASGHSQGEETPIDAESAQLRAIARAAVERRRMPQAEMRQLILALCSIRTVSLAEMAALMDRRPQSLREQYLIPLLRAGKLRYLYPGEPAHPRQAYVTVETDERGE